MDDLYRMHGEWPKIGYLDKATEADQSRSYIIFLLQMFPNSIFFFDSSLH